MQQVAQLPHQREHAAGGVEILHVALAGGLQVHQDRGFLAQRVQPLEVDLHPDPAGDGGQVDQRIGRAAEREQHAQRILDLFLGDELGGPDGMGDEAHRQLAGLLGHAQPVGMDGRGARPPSAA